MQFLFFHAICHWLRSFVLSVWVFARDVFGKHFRVLPKNLFIYASFSCSFMTFSSFFFLKGAFIDMSVCVGKDEMFVRVRLIFGHIGRPLL
jgi:hypothetical protein